MLDAFSVCDSASVQDLDNMNAALAQLESWGQAPLEYRGILTGLMRHWSWGQLLDLVRDNCSERSQFQKAVKRVQDGFDNIGGMAYTYANAEELRASFRDMITAFSDMSEKDQMVSNTTVKMVSREGCERWGKIVVRKGGGIWC